MGISFRPLRVKSKLYIQISAVTNLGTNIPEIFDLYRFAVGYNDAVDTDTFGNEIITKYGKHWIMGCRVLTMEKAEFLKIWYLWKISWIKFNEMQKLPKKSFQYFMISGNGFENSWPRWTRVTSAEPEDM